MAGVLNNSARRITLNHKTKSGFTIKHVLQPLEFKDIPDEQWNLLKKNKVVEAWTDKGDLVVGGKKKLILPDDFEPEPELSEEEKQKQVDALAEEEAAAEAAAKTEARAKAKAARTAAKQGN